MIPFRDLPRTAVHSPQGTKHHPILAGRFHGEFRRKWKMIHGMKDYVDAKNQLGALAAWLSKINLDAVSSLEEAEGETLTIIELGAPAKLRSTLLSTNPIESAFDSVRARSKRVKHWRKRQDQSGPTEQMYS